jgi:hypothetical protein
MALYINIKWLLWQKQVINNINISPNNFNISANKKINIIFTEHKTLEKNILCGWLALHMSAKIINIDNNSKDILQKINIDNNSKDILQKNTLNNSNIYLIDLASDIKRENLEHIIVAIEKTLDDKDHKNNINTQDYKNINTAHIWVFTTRIQDLSLFSAHKFNIWSIDKRNTLIKLA